MKRSQTVELFLVVSAAAALSGCDNSDIRRCVDVNNNVVNDQNCLRSGTGAHWYYGGSTSHSGGGGGVRVSGGSTEASSVRGVFGGAGEGHGGGEGGGHGSGGGGE